MHKFTGDSSLVQQSSFTQSQQPVFQINGDMVLANHFPVEIAFFHSMTRTYIVEPFHCTMKTLSRFAENLLAFGKISFLSLTLLLLSSGIRMLDIQAFHYHKTHKNNSNHVAVLVFTCCAPPTSLRVVDSLRHTHAFSRITLREFPVKWATMAAPMVSENVRFKINFIYDVQHSYNIKKNTCVTIFYLEWYVGIGFFNAFSTLWLHVPLKVPSPPGAWVTEAI